MLHNCDTAPGDTAYNTIICIVPGCGKKSDFACPVCNKLGLPISPFCSQFCFNSYYEAHKTIHVSELGSRADELKTKGGIFFKALQFNKAIAMYEEAWKLKKSDAVFPSNLSACYFELGQYEKSARFANLSVELLSVVEDKLLLKNLIRLGKCYVFIGDINKAKSIQQLLHSRSVLDEAAAEVLFWIQSVEIRMTILYSITNNKDSSNNNAVENAINKQYMDRVVSLSRYRPNRITSVREYYPVGQCLATSILLSSNMTGERNDYKGKRLVQILQQQLQQQEQQQQQRFLLSGLGDARHLFATLIDLHSQLAELSQPQHNLYRCCPTAIVIDDVKAASLAKLFVMLVALTRMSAFKVEQYGRDVAATKAACVVIYLFVGNVVPLYIAVEIRKIILGLVENGLPSSLTCFINISEVEWKAVKTTLVLWSSPSTITAKQAIDNLITRSDIVTTTTGSSPTFSSGLKNLLSGGSNANTGVSSSGDDKNNSVMDDIANEFKYFSIHKYLLPPRVLIDSEAELKSLLIGREKSGIKGQKALNKYIYRSWVNNPTMSDPEWHNVTNTRVQYIWDVEDIIEKLFAPAYVPHPPSNPPPTSVYDWMYCYFHALATAISYFSNNPLSVSITAHVKDINDLCSNSTVSALFEVQQNNSISINSNNNNDGNHYDNNNYNKLSLSPVSLFSIDSTRRYNRMYLSNIPDYTSLLYVFTEAIPLLKYEETSFIECEVMLNTIVWADYQQYIYSASLLTSAAEAEKLLNIKLISGDLVSSEPHWAIAKQPFVVDVTVKEELLEWCIRVLLAFAFPALRDPTLTTRENCPCSVVSFFRCLYYCIQLGYPRHWFVSLLKNILENKCIAAAVAPTSSPNQYIPPPNSAAKKLVNLSSVSLELRTLTALYLPLLELPSPYVTSSSSNSSSSSTTQSTEQSLPDYQCIGEYSVTFQHLFDSSNDRELGEIAGYPFCAVLGLLLYQSTVVNEGVLDSVLRDRLLEGSCYRDGSAYQLLSVLSWRSEKYTMKFHLPELDYNRMCSSLSGRWSVVLIRTDSWRRISVSVDFRDVKLIKKLFA